MRTVPIQRPPDVPECTIDTTPEEWADAHRIVTGHVASVIEWGALCTCGALWSRDPAKGGEDRRRVRT